MQTFALISETCPTGIRKFEPAKIRPDICNAAQWIHERRGCPSRWNGTCEDRLCMDDTGYANGLIGGCACYTMKT